MFPKNGAAMETDTHIRALLNPLNAKLNPVCHLLALLGAHHILHVGRIRVNISFGVPIKGALPREY